MPELEKRFQEEHTSLLEQWKKSEHHDGKCFVHDGVITPEGWFTRRRRLVFLLKEAYDKCKRRDFYLCTRLATKDISEQLRDPAFAERFRQAGAAWDVAL